MATKHRIFICTSCRAKDVPYRSGADLIAEFHAARHNAPNQCANDFENRTADCMAGSESPCTPGFQATGKASYLFGNIDLDADIAAVVSFAALYQSPPDGWCRRKLCPRKLQLNTLARIPAMKTQRPALTGEMP